LNCIGRRFRPLLTRPHPSLIKARRLLIDLWHSTQEDALISTSHPLACADRARIRQPGDAGFTSGPRVDGGSVKRWEPEGHRRGDVYDKIWQGKWDDPPDASCQVPMISDVYDGAGACSMFRIFQGWLSMSHTGPNEGTLMVNPSLQLSTAHFLLRPLFKPPTEPLSIRRRGLRFRILNPEN
jgi:hypothetical protein